MKIIGLTGGIGTGKSLVADIFRKAGVPVLDADRVTRDVYLPGTDAHEKIRRVFGQAVLREDGTVNRQALGDLVFKDPGKMKLLEEITHPEIQKRMGEFVRACAEGKKPFCVIEAALIFEKERGSLFDIIITVSASRVDQTERLKKRDGLPEEEIASRIDAQLSIAEKEKRADFVVDNSGSIEETRRQVLKIIDDLMKT
ncbi:MAG: dephospho-CoA kinase [Deltaproteobacteria bacterium]|nr:dephospho-CoA kinase [Deltaproteobacteria bacterium]NIS78208.1 dephospho-CoA kinase [Deltaproteobacteria bacterium]